ncbi:glycosyltransferase [Paracoccus ravus]|uniref:glycosyltransferase n=1 Tax=Paracoccus ravus TaxID=2447760 RepID=UPI0014308C11|nr:glycosyltransferase [Paracoccus ravus]
MSDRLLVGICTYRRDSIAETLDSLRATSDCGLDVEIAVADNDLAPSARPLVARHAAGHPMTVTYLHAPCANISIARNALLDHAYRNGFRLLVYIDDDQRVRQDTLPALVAAWRAGAGAVLGTVLADYGSDTPEWMLRARPHDTRPQRGSDGACRWGYTGNNLADLADPAWAGRRFDLSHGRSGGEDTAWFAGYLAAGGRLVHAPEAIVDEQIPPDRARLSWLLRRRYRMGHTHASLGMRGKGVKARASAAAVAGAKMVACLGLAAAGGIPARRNPQLMRACLHAGVAAHLLGARQISLYGGNGGEAKETDHA